MKRIALGLLISLVGLTLALALAWSRPDILPAWARRGGPAPEKVDTGLYCKEHGVPEKFCTLCHEELKATLMLCKEHGGIPEDICTLCHPEVAKEHNIAMCPNGHGLPRHFCVKCGAVPSASVAEPDDGWCATHNTPEASCVVCAREEAQATGRAATVRVCRQPLPVVRLASAAVARQIGLRTVAVTEERHAHRITANAAAAYDANRYAEIHPRVAGFLRDVRADLGQAVRPGEVLAVVDSAEVSAAKTQYLSARAAVRLTRATYDRVKVLTHGAAVAVKQELEALTALNQAEAGAMDAEQKLRNFRFGEAELARILEERDTRGMLNVTAPMRGSVVLRHAVQGEAVLPTSGLFAVADTSRMWLWIEVYERDIAAVSAGQAVTFAISGTDSGAESPTFSGRVTWVGTDVDPTTRATRVRAELANPEGRLRAHQFGRAEIQVGPEHNAVVVPRSALQRKDRADLVFLPQERGSYRAQRVLTRPTGRGDVVEVTWGLKPGQRVVTDGAFLLTTEITRGAIGAGCCD
jgi:cobalt-zinc-cadmium efflux system membrane fusion protein